MSESGVREERTKMNRGDGKNKKLRYCQQNSGSVVLGVLYDISREKIFHVIGHESYRMRQNNAK